MSMKKFSKFKLLVAFTAISIGLFVATMTLTAFNIDNSITNGISRNQPIKEDYVTLKDGDVFPQEPIENLEDYYKIWGGQIAPPTSKIDISGNVNIILKSIETNECKTEDVGYQIAMKLCDFGYVDLFRFETFIWKDDIDGIGSQCLQNLYKSETARKHFLDFAIYVYGTCEESLPMSFKKQLVSYIDNSLDFLKTYSKNRRNYFEMENRNRIKREDNVVNYVGQQSEFIGAVGHYNAFLFRRIEKDKIPISELKSYLVKLKLEINNSISNSLYSNYKNIKINENGLYMSDEFNSSNSFNNTLKIWSKYSADTIYVRNFSQIKCIKDKGKNYYKVTSYEGVKAVYSYSKFGYDFIHNKEFSEKENSILFDENLKVLYADTFSNKTNDIDYSSYFIATNNIPSSNKISLTKKNGVYYIPTVINGVPMEFVYDTGASTVSISLAEAKYLLNQGKLAKSDILDSQYFTDANGDISEGTKIILREIKIGNKTLYNVEASIVHNLNAPLLLGQTALERFGKIIFDTKNQILTLE
jgi:aspartyl protease family protein